MVNTTCGSLSEAIEAFLPRRQAALVLDKLDSYGIGCTCELEDRHIPAFIVTDIDVANPVAAVAKLNALLTERGAVMVR